MIIKYAKEKYPNENVRIDFCDEEKVKQVIELGIAEYIKKENDLYKARILGEFNTVSNNIEEDIKYIDYGIKELKDSYELHNKEWANKILTNMKESIENILNKYKKNQKIVDGVKNLIENDFNSWFEGDAEFPDDATKIELVKYIKVDKLEKLLEEE